jgi:hypothetical protein
MKPVFLCTDSEERVLKITQINKQGTCEMFILYKHNYKLAQKHSLALE